MDSKLGLLLQAVDKPTKYDGVHLPIPHHLSPSGSLSPKREGSFSQKGLDNHLRMDSNLSHIYNSLPLSNLFSLTNTVDLGRTFLSNQIQALPIVQLGPGGPICSVHQTHVFKPLAFPESMSVDDLGRFHPLTPKSLSKSLSTSNISASAFSAFPSTPISEIKKPKPIVMDSLSPFINSNPGPGSGTFTISAAKSESHLPIQSSSLSADSSVISPLHIPIVPPYILSNPNFLSTIPSVPPFSLPQRSLGIAGTSPVDSKKSLASGKVKRLKRKDKVHTCEFSGCGFSFPTRFSLKRHQKRHTGEKPFLCNWVENGEPCGTRFAEKSTLKRHLQTHTGEKPFKCSRPGCDRVFADRLNCHRHERRHRSAWIPTSQL